MKRIYFDYNATTPVDHEVAAHVNMAFTDIFGNPSSIHEEGRKARIALDDSREEVASFLNCSCDEVIFSGSGSESNNMAISGVAESLSHKGRHIVTTRVEHPSVKTTCMDLELKGWKVTYLEIDPLGRINLDNLKSSIHDDTVLLSLMLANNETGVIFPVKEAASIARERGVIVHTDAVQAVGKIEVDVQCLGVDLLSLSGHKFYAPKGVGALYVRKGLNLKPLMHGGGQENGKRPGTENLPGIMGLAKAAKISAEKLDEERQRIAGLASILKEGIKRIAHNAVFNGDPHNSVPNTLSISFRGMSGESLIMAFDLEGFALSAGSACSSGALSPSHVLTEMGLDNDSIRGTIRLSLGRWSTEDHVNTFLKILPSVLERQNSTANS